MPENAGSRPEIIHDEKARSFYCVMDGRRCSADYAVLDGRTLELTHTYVHPDLRGRGVASALLAAFSRYAMEKGMKVVPTCSYAASFYRRNGEFAGLVSEQAGNEGGAPVNGDCCRWKKS